MAIGDHIRVRRTAYTHHAIDCGDGWVIHYTDAGGLTAKAGVRRERLSIFLKGAETYDVVAQDSPFTPRQIIQRAESMIGRDRYHLLLENCEHFATWCRTGSWRSAQVERNAGLVACVTGAAAIGWTRRGPHGALVGAGVGVVSWVAGERLAAWAEQLQPARPDLSPA